MGAPTAPTLGALPALRAAPGDVVSPGDFLGRRTPWRVLPSKVEWLQSSTDALFKTPDAEDAIPEPNTRGLPYVWMDVIDLGLLCEGYGGFPLPPRRFCRAHGLLGLGPALVARPCIHAAIDADVAVGNEPGHIEFVALKRFLPAYQPARFGDRIVVGGGCERHEREHQKGGSKAAQGFTLLDEV